MDKIKAKKLKKKGIVVKTKEEKRQIRRAKEKERKAKKKKRKGGHEDPDFEDKDQVKFNEVCHAPPEKLVGVSQNAQKSKVGGLLLAKKLKKSQKKPEISLARKKVLEDERQRAINLYREMKKNKLAS